MVCIIVMFLSAVWTLILTAPIHCIHWARDVMLHVSKSDEDTNSSWMAWGWAHLKNNNNILGLSVGERQTCLDLFGEILDFIDSSIIFVGEFSELLLCVFVHLSQVCALILCVTQTPLQYKNRSIETNTTENMLWI